MQEIYAIYNCYAMTVITSHSLRCHQATSQIEQENWINALHSACASSFARQHGKENTIKLLRSEIHKLENSIDIVSMPACISTASLL